MLAHQHSTYSALGRTGCALGLLACFASPVWAQQKVLMQGPAGLQISEADLRGSTLRIPESQRTLLLSSPQNVANETSNLYTRRALAAEVEKSGIDKDPVVAAALRVAHDRVLSDIRIEQIDKAALPDSTALMAYARSQYTAEPKRFQGPEEVRVRHILLQGDDAEAQAKKILEDLKQGADFAALAKAKSFDKGSAEVGGELGFIAPGKTVPEFEKAAFALKSKGDLSIPIKSQFGYHIIQLEERKPAGLRPFSEVQEQLLAEARNSMRENARRAKSEELLKKAKLDEGAVEAFSQQFKPEVEVK